MGISNCECVCSKGAWVQLNMIWLLSFISVMLLILHIKRIYLCNTKTANVKLNVDIFEWNTCLCCLTRAYWIEEIIVTSHESHVPNHGNLGCLIVHSYFTWPLSITVTPPERHNVAAQRTSNAAIGSIQKIHLKISSWKVSHTVKASIR